MLSITHTAREGTLLDGTTRGDQVGAIIAPMGWRWGRSMGQWFLPRSRGTAPRRAVIEQTEQALRDAGLVVVVHIDADAGDRAVVEQAREQRAAERVAVLQQRAQQVAGQAQARERAADELAEVIPLGQPILVGHHSQAGATRQARRIGAHMDAAGKLRADAARAGDAARRAAARAAKRRDPVTVANRIERLRAQIRADEALLDKISTEHPTSLAVTERLEHARADLEYWVGVRDEQIADGQARVFGPDTVSAGDLVLIGRQWRTVVKANRKTVAVATGYSWTDKYPWHRVSDHQRKDG